MALTYSRQMAVMKFALKTFVQSQTQPRGLRYDTLTHYLAIKRSLMHGQDLNSTTLLRSSCRVLGYDVRALNVSKEHTASIYRAEIKAEATRSRDAGAHLPHYTAS